MSTITRVPEATSVLRSRRAGIVLGLLLLTAAHATYADVIEDADSWAAVSSEELDELRGGFLTDNGLRIGFAFESVVRVNGELQARTVLDMPSFAIGAGRSNRPASGATLSAQLPQNLSSNLNTLVQNSLDNQVIQHSKILNIEISGIGALRGTGFRSRVNTQVIDTLR